MKTQESRRLLSKIFGIAIASASLLVSLPTHANPSSVSQAQTGTQAAPTQATSTTIVDIASKSRNLTTLVKALKAAGLVDTLSGPGPFTVFAPTDAAFSALPKGTLQKLLKPANKATLQKLLTYHVVSGAIDSKSLKSGKVATVEGENISVRVSSGEVRINKAKVIKADIQASNGYIHIINAVLIPPEGLK